MAPDSLVKLRVRWKTWSGKTLACLDSQKTFVVEFERLAKPLLASSQNAWAHGCSPTCPYMETDAADQRP